MPTMVISVPLAHHERVVTSAFDAPTAKCASVLTTNEAITAGIPTAKKKGMIGMNPPNAVETDAESGRRQGHGTVAAGTATVKKKGSIGMNPPMAVETVAESVDRQGFGKFSSDRPSSSETSVRRNCLGSFWMRSAIDRASSAENPLSW